DRVPSSILSPLLHGQLLLGDPLSKLPECPLRITAKLLQELATIQLSGSLPSTVILLCYWELAPEGFNPLPQASGFTLEPTAFTREALLDNAVNSLLSKHPPGLLLTSGLGPSSRTTSVE